MSHAILVIGPPGPERRAAAHRSAARLIGATGDREVLVLENRHADVMELLEPLRIEHVREVTSGLARPPLLGGGRAVLFGELTGATREAQNALLRIVEEPPVHLTFVGEAARTSDLLPTLLSRFAIEKVPRSSQEEILDTLVREHQGVDMDVASAAARFGQGYLDPAREALSALLLLQEKLPADDGSPDWFVRAAESVESSGQTWLNGLAGTFAARYESTADERFLMAWQKVEEARSALLRHANTRLVAEVLFAQLSDLGVLRHGAGGWHTVSQRREGI
jgi:hypothetical protein